MEELIEKLEEYCRLHGVPPKNNILEMCHLEFGTDKDEVADILHELSELYYDACD